MSWWKKNKNTKKPASASSQEVIAPHAFESVAVNELSRTVDSHLRELTHISGLSDDTPFCQEYAKHVMAVHQFDGDVEAFALAKDTSGKSGATAIAHWHETVLQRALLAKEQDHGKQWARAFEDARQLLARFGMPENTLDTIPSDVQSKLLRNNVGEFDEIIKHLYSTEADIDLMCRAFATLDSAWGSGDSTDCPDKVAMQLTVQSALIGQRHGDNLQDSEHLPAAKIIHHDNRAFFNAYIRSQHRFTQEMFERLDISEIAVYRLTDIDVGLRPLASFTATPGILTRFMDDNSEHLDGACLVAWKIPVTRIWGTCLTGVGMPYQNEVLVMGKGETFGCGDSAWHEFAVTGIAPTPRKPS